MRLHPALIKNTGLHTENYSRLQGGSSTIPVFCHLDRETDTASCRMRPPPRPKTSFQPVGYCAKYSRAAPPHLKPCIFSRDESFLFITPCFGRGNSFQCLP
ncbi:MAG: hypothetical protein DU429_07690 [Candidatus Tokpelaia sp.]|nr:MAG: hypothetical protein DU429_07690 [Candidatus Tokpelaia sp.]KAA6206291.1 MAG: hypothetical protein DU430_01875 [Candidatus Tokpelaia sp.]